MGKNINAHICDLHIYIYSICLQLNDITTGIRPTNSIVDKFSLLFLCLSFVNCQGVDCYILEFIFENHLQITCL